MSPRRAALVVTILLGVTGAITYLRPPLRPAAPSAVPAVVERLALRGRRDGQAVVLFSTSGGGRAAPAGVGGPVLPVGQAVEALRRALDGARVAGGR